MKIEDFGESEADSSDAFDLYFTNQKGEQFIIEVQRASQSNFMDRIVYYSSFLIQQQAIQGADWDFFLKPIYTLSFLNFLLPKDETEPNQLYHKLKLIDVVSGKLRYKKLTFIYVELPKFKKRSKQNWSHLDDWVYLLSHSHHLENLPEHLKEPVFMELMEKSKYYSLSFEERAKYNAELKAARDNFNTMEYAKTTGFEQGMEKGLRKGMKKGIEQGKYHKQIEIILKGFAKGLSIQFLAELSELSEEEVIRIIESHKQ
jgi:predicted transposase/invertase (TIGR01784 family)